MRGPVIFEYAGTHIPVNRFGLRDLKRLEAVERALTDVSLTKLELTPLQGDFSLRHLQEIHKAIFGRVYPWAGLVRDHGLSKQGSIFDSPDTFDATFSALQGYLARHDYLRGTRKDDFARRMAVIYGQMNRAHPFREGNGRATRYFLSRLADRAGYVLDYAKVSKEEWNLSAIASFGGHGAAMEQVFSAIAVPARAVLFDTAPRDRALKAAPELAAVFDALDRMAATLKVFEPGERDRMYSAARRAISGRLRAGYTVLRQETRGQRPQHMLKAQRPRRPIGVA